MREMQLDDTVMYFIYASIALFLLIFIIRYFKNPFTLPVIKVRIDISKRRTPDLDECIEEWIIEKHKNNPTALSIVLSMLDDTLEKWDNDCSKKVKWSFLLRIHRKRQYNKLKLKVASMRYEMFQFTFYRIHHNSNNITEDIESIVTKTNEYMLSTDHKLSQINYVSSLSKYNESNQRKLMTGSLRQQIKNRDNYTCQICGISKKFLDDLCLGLGDYLLFEIDHVKAVSQGGVTVDDNNLQCLCWRCNRAKGGNKTNEEIRNTINYGIKYLRH